MGLRSPSSSGLDKFWRTMDAVGIIPTAVLTFVTMLLIAGEILSRLLFNHSFYGLPDLAAYLVLIFAFWPLGVVERYRRHLRTEVLLDLLGKKKRLLAERILNVIGLGLMVFTTAAVGTKWVSIYHAREVSPTILLPLWPFALSMVIGFATLCAALAVHIYVVHDEPPEGEGTLLDEDEGGTNTWSSG